MLQRSFMTTYFHLLLASLAVYRLSLMLSSESGPVELFARMRKQCPPQTSQGKGIRCFNCWSVWLAGGFVILALYLSEQMWPFVYLFALSGAAMVINKIAK